MNPPCFTAEKLTIRNVRRDFPEWHQGRPRFALWALDVDVPAVKQRVHAAQRHLCGRLLDCYCRQPHVTMSLCGFPSPSPRHADDFGAERLRAQLQALDQERMGPFELEIGGLASFSSAPYLTVSDVGGRIAGLRDCLAIGDPDRAMERHTAHVTVGLYADAWPTQAVQGQLDRFELREPLRVRISRIHLMSYAAAVIGGPLTRMADYDLAAGTLTLNASFPFPCLGGVRPNASALT